MKKLILQMVKFGAVGFLCFLIDYGIMLLLTELAGVNYLISCCISFSVSVIVNYLLSMHFVFAAKANMKKRTQFVIFVILSVIGLGLNQLFMWLFVDLVHIPYQIAKLAVTAIVMLFNFVTRKVFLEEKEQDANAK
mgnify:FL=1